MFGYRHLQLLRPKPGVASLRKSGARGRRPHLETGDRPVKTMRLVALFGLLGVSGACADIPTAVHAEEPPVGQGIVGPEGRG